MWGRSRAPSRTLSRCSRRVTRDGPGSCRDRPSLASRSRDSCEPGRILQSASGSFLSGDTLAARVGGLAGADHWRGSRGWSYSRLALALRYRSRARSRLAALEPCRRCVRAAAWPGIVVESRRVEWRPPCDGHHPDEAVADPAYSTRCVSWHSSPARRAPSKSLTASTRAGAGSMSNGWSGRSERKKGEGRTAAYRTADTQSGSFAARTART